jgi:hypothetical protein
VSDKHGSNPYAHVSDYLVDANIRSIADDLRATGGSIANERVATVLEFSPEELTSVREALALHPGHRGVCLTPDGFELAALASTIGPRLVLPNASPIDARERTSAAVAAFFRYAAATAELSAPHFDDPAELFAAAVSATVAVVNLGTLPPMTAADAEQVNRMADRYLVGRGVTAREMIATLRALADEASP